MDFRFRKRHQTAAITQNRNRWRPIRTRQMQVRSSVLRGWATRVHALVVKFGPDSRVTSWQLNDQNMFSGEASMQ
jgi:hypothetical protein